MSDLTEQLNTFEVLEHWKSESIKNYKLAQSIADERDRIRLKVISERDEAQLGLKQRDETIRDKEKQLTIYHRENCELILTSEQKDETIKKLEEVVLDMDTCLSKARAKSNFSTVLWNCMRSGCQSKHAETIKSIKERRK